MLHTVLFIIIIIVIIIVILLLLFVIIFVIIGYGHQYMCTFCKFLVLLIFLYENFLLSCSANSGGYELQ